MLWFLVILVNTGSLSTLFMVLDCTVYIYSITELLPAFKFPSLMPKSNSYMKYEVVFRRVCGLRHISSPESCFSRIRTRL